MKNTILSLKKQSLTPKFYLKLPESPGVYVYFKKGKPIYIGKAINLKKRVASYFRLNLETKTKKMISEATEMTYIKVESEFEALLLEAKLIKSYQPQYNIIAKDDKHPLYIVITKDEFPIVKAVRKNDLKSYSTLSTHGPFPSYTNVKDVLKILRRIFPYSDHKLGKRACLYSQIGLCNPCPNEISKITDSVIKKSLTHKYKLNIKRIKALLDGKIKNVTNELYKEMKVFSDRKLFEEALELRDKIRKIEYITNRNTKPESYLENPNLYEDIKEGELKDLSKILLKYRLNIKKLERIECFDIAHLQGAGKAASMVTFIKGEPAKEYYRHFKIYKAKDGDDYAAMKEVAGRRKKHFEDWGRPNLIIVDGGKGQLSMFMNEFKDTGIPIIGLAKRFETLVIPSVYLGANTFKEHRLLPGAAKNLVLRLRNEAHRFAQSYHHKLISKSLFERGV